MDKLSDIHHTRLSSSVPALLLAAGLGTRLKPITRAIPKCLAPIHDKPLLGYWLDLLGNAGMEPLIVNTHHYAGMVDAFIEASPWRNRIRIAYEPELLGTGGTILKHEAALASGPFMVVHADNLSSFNVATFMNAHLNRPTGCCLTMMTFITPTPESCGIVDLDASGIVRAFHEKVANPPGNLANGAIYIMEPEVFRILKGCGKAYPDISLDLIPRCIGRMFAWLNSCYHRDIGNPESYRAANREFQPPTSLTEEPREQ